MLEIVLTGPARVFDRIQSRVEGLTPCWFLEDKHYLLCGGDKIKVGAPVRVWYGHETVFALRYRIVGKKYNFNEAEGYLLDSEVKVEAQQSCQA